MMWFTSSTVEEPKKNHMTATPGFLCFSLSGYPRLLPIKDKVYIALKIAIKKYMVCISIWSFW